MSKVSGFVEEIKTSSGHSSRGPWTAYRVRMLTDDGQTSWVGFGFDQPGFTVGQHITFDAQDSDKGLKFVQGSGQITATPPERPTPQQSSSGGGGGGNRGGGGGYKNDPKRQASIIMQHSQEMAIRTLDSFLAHDGVVHTTAKAKPNQAKRFHEFVALLDKFTVKFYHEAANPDQLLEKVPYWTLDQVEAKGDLPEDANEEPTPQADDTPDDDNPFTQEEANDGGSF